MAATKTEYPTLAYEYRCTNHPNLWPLIHGMPCNSWWMVVFGQHKCVRTIHCIARSEQIFKKQKYFITKAIYLTLYMQRVKNNKGVWFFMGNECLRMKIMSMFLLFTFLVVPLLCDIYIALQDHIESENSLDIFNLQKDTKIKKDDVSKKVFFTKGDRKPNTNIKKTIRYTILFGLICNGDNKSWIGSHNNFISSRSLFSFAVL